MSRCEVCGLATLFGLVWFFIFIAGWLEWAANLEWGGDNCTEIQRGVDDDPYCFHCDEGFVNGGLKCYRDREDIPPVKTGAMLGPKTYFGFIIIIQLSGAVLELALIGRLWLRKLMPRKELAILLGALAIELTRMCMVDVFVLQQYFSGESYSIFHAPGSCDNDAGWFGVDGGFYCADYNSTDYYIATHRTAFSSDDRVCTLFPESSPMVDYSETSGTWGAGGHPRYTRVGWVIGGEFALYYFFATFVNEVADNLFVVPTTTTYGWQCKVFSIALELFQLGALCPAAIFTHGECLHYTDPMGVSLHLIRGIIVAFGYSIWAFLLLSVPFAAAGLVAIAAPFIIGTLLLETIALVRGSCPIRRCRSESAASWWQAWAKYFRDLAARMGRYGCQSIGAMCGMCCGFAFFPLLVGGGFLGFLVIVGLASKSGTMQTITAVVLLSDVFFKLVATLVTEVLDYALHLRVVRRLAEQAAWAATGSACPPRRLGAGDGA